MHAAITMTRTKPEEPAGADGHEDAVRDSSGGVCGFLSTYAHMNQTPR